MTWVCQFFVVIKRQVQYVILNLAIDRTNIYEGKEEGRKQLCLRLKIIFGGKLRRRKFDNQAVELFIRYAMQGPNDSSR
ncbi:MAG: hypothetical protein F6K48_24195 [Okeania sp. SIO3H1]|nr:hypothetical protein [Okeania sp. SIO3H1]